MNLQDKVSAGGEIMLFTNWGAMLHVIVSPLARRVFLAMNWLAYQHLAESLEKYSALTADLSFTQSYEPFTGRILSIDCANFAVSDSEWTVANTIMAEFKRKPMLRILVGLVRQFISALIYGVSISSNHTKRE